MLLSNFKGMATETTVICRLKKSATKIQVPCPDVIKMHNKGMGVVELIAQGDAAYHLD